MRSEDLIILALAGAAAWWIIKNKSGSAAGGQRATIPALDYGMVPNSAMPGQPGWGWTYYQNGTVIDPAGNYYHNGQLVWSPV